MSDALPVRRSRARMVMGSVGVLAVALGVAVLFATGPRREVARLLGTHLPASARDLRIQRVQPTRDVPQRRYFIRFDIDAPQFAAFRADARLGMPQLGLDWTPPDARALPWWNPSTDTPGDGQRELAPDGFIAARWESGHAFVMVVEPSEPTR